MFVAISLRQIPGEYGVLVDNAIGVPRLHGGGWRGSAEPIFHLVASERGRPSMRPFASLCPLPFDAHEKHLCEVHLLEEAMVAVSRKRKRGNRCSPPPLGSSGSIAGEIGALSDRGVTYFRAN